MIAFQGSFYAECGFYSNLCYAVGLFVAAIAFLASNLFLQVPLSVIAVFLTSDSELENFTPDPPQQITSNYLVPGLRVKKILPSIQEKSVSPE